MLPIINIFLSYCRQINGSSLQIKHSLSVFVNNYLLSQIILFIIIVMSQFTCNSILLLSDYSKFSRGRKHQRGILSSFRRSFKGACFCLLLTFVEQLNLTVKCFLGTRSLSSHGVSATCKPSPDTCHLSPHVRVRSASENRGAGMLCYYFNIYFSH